MALAVGDVVVLKSGGPLMTVEFINEDKSVRCSWFDENKRASSVLFSLRHSKKMMASR